MLRAASLVLGLVGCASILPLLTSATLTRIESLFVDTTSAAGARQHLAFYTSIDHVAGTPGDYQTALYTQQQMQSYGLQAEIVPFKVLINYPISRSLQMTSPVQFNASLAENVYPDDPTSGLSKWRNLTFHGYGASGDVQGEVVYVNYGAVSDFDYLASINVSVVGKIALARYGTVFRGLKVQNAQAYGAIGCLIYSDPIDDGFTRGKVYTDGPWRPETGVQRGSVLFLSRCSGDPGMIERDPTICGYDTADLIPSIPSLPISYGDALPLLQGLQGVPPPTSWIGGLNVSYFLGSNGASTIVHLVTEMEYQTTVLWNVITTIPGAHPNPEVAKQQVIIGNHRDAWVFGATDPNSGTATMLEIARGFGALLSSGWVPDRTLILNSWDGEEYGLLGSVNYVESHAQDLATYAVAYLNVDVAVTGSWLSVSASSSLGNLAISTSKDVIDPNTGNTLYNVWSAQQPGGVNIGILGSGSDFAGFLHHIGVPSLDLAFDGDYGVYHSVYDSFFWMEQFGDPNFLYHRAMAQLWGLMALRLSTAKVLPIEVSSTASALVSYLTTIQSVASAASMPLPSLDWQSLTVAIESIQAPSAIFECYRQAMLTNTSATDNDLEILNTNLANFERLAWIITPEDGFVDDGLPARKWYKHIMQAPGLETGYASNVFPSLYDAIDHLNTTEAQLQIGLIANKISKAALLVNSMIPYVAEGCTF